MDDIENLDDAIAKFENIKIPNVKRGMFVSGWEDPDDSVDEDEDPEGNISPSSLSKPHLTPLPFQPLLTVSSSMLLKRAT